MQAEIRALIAGIEQNDRRRLPLLLLTLLSCFVASIGMIWLTDLPDLEFAFDPSILILFAGVAVFSIWQERQNVADKRRLLMALKAELDEPST